MSKGKFWNNNQITQMESSKRRRSPVLSCVFTLPLSKVFHNLAHSCTILHILGYPKYFSLCSLSFLDLALDDCRWGYPNPVLLHRKKVSGLSLSLSWLSCKSMLTNAEVTRAVTKRLSPTNTSDQKISLALWTCSPSWVFLTGSVTRVFDRMCRTLRFNERRQKETMLRRA